MPRGPSQAQVETFRRFNRFYTRRIGVLEEGLLDTPFTLAQARVLFELGTRGRTTASDLGAALRLDPGYLSRILRGFAARGLVARRKAAGDGRRVLLALTAKGRRTFRSLDGKSRDEASALLARLPQARRRRLLAALDAAQEVLSGQAPPPQREVALRTQRAGDAGWAIARHAEIYADEYGWNEEFEALVATLFARFLARHDPATERCWIAERDGERAGCVFVVRNEDDPSLAQLRCLLVEPDARGHGIGRRLVAACVDFARSAGYRGIMLWTNDVLVSARRIYAAAGFTLAKEERHHSFGRELTGQFWTLDLR